MYNTILSYVLLILQYYGIPFAICQSPNHKASITPKTLSCLLVLYTTVFCVKLTMSWSGKNTLQTRNTLPRGHNSARVVTTHFFTLHFLRFLAILLFAIDNLYNILRASSKSQSNALLFGNRSFLIP